MTPTPRSLAERLCRYITDDAAIIAHVKRDFGVTMTRKDLQRIRGTMPRKLPPKQLEPLYGTLPIIRAKKADPLLKALAGYHYKRATNDDARKHWRGLM